MPPRGRILDAGKKYKKVHPDQYVKTTYLNFSQCLSTFIVAWVVMTGDDFTLPENLTCPT